MVFDVSNRYRVWTFLRIISRPYIFWFYLMAFVALYVSCHNVLFPYVTKLLLDAVSASSTDSLIHDSFIPALILIVASFAINVVWRLYDYAALRAIPLMKADIIGMATEHLRGQSYQFFQSAMRGILGSKVNELTGTLQELINSTFKVSSQLLTIFLSSFVAWSVNPYFGILFISMALTFIGISIYAGKAIKPYSASFAEAKAKSVGNIVDTFSNIRSILLFAGERYERSYLQKTTDVYVEKDKMMQMKNIINASLLCSLCWLLEFLCIALLLYLGSKGLVTVGDFALILMLSMSVIEKVWYVAEILLSLGEKVGACEQALGSVFVKKIQEDTMNYPSLQVTAGRVEFKEVTFAYKTERPIINNLNLVIPGGKKIGLVGYSGTGKSTILKLLTRLLDANKGKIIIDDQDITKVNIHSLRDHIAFIPQSPRLFHRTVYENILYGNRDASEEDVINAAKKANAHDFISELDEGYSTLVGENGMKLSGGQRQRIVIARAILKNAPILVLDEATSSLDATTISKIQEALDEAMKNRTVIVVAHRLSTILSMDEIIVLDKGNIVAQGTHSDLISQGGMYSQMWTSQDGSSKI